MAQQQDKSINELMTAQNIALFNLLFWHQIFLEGVSLSTARNFDVVLRSLYDEFKKYLANVRYQKLDELTKAELNDFIYRFKKAQTKFYSRYTQQLIKVLQQFVAADVEGTRGILQHVTGKTLAQADAERQHATLKGTAVLQPGGTYGLWASIATDPIPANGMTTAQMLQGFGNTSVNKVSQAIRMAYANGWTKDELINRLFGLPQNNWRDGYFAKMYQQNNTLVSTAIQHVSSIVQGAVTSVYLGSYTWVSIIDGHTTAICTERNGRTFEFGKGPIPPAHWGCRSKTVGKFDGADDIAVPATFAAWFATQPTDVVSALLGSSLAVSLSAGKLRRATLASVAQSLTLVQFLAKIKQLLGVFK